MLKYRIARTDWDFAHEDGAAREVGEPDRVRHGRERNRPGEEADAEEAHGGRRRAKPKAKAKKATTAQKPVAKKKPQTARKPVRRRVTARKAASSPQVGSKGRGAYTALSFFC